MPNPEIVVVGSFVQDLTFTCREFPRPGETTIGQFASGPGGKGSNQAVAAARGGGRVAFIGAVGMDVFGAGARSFQAGEGIEGLFLEKEGSATGAAAILVNAHGQNEIVVSLDANAALSANDVDSHEAKIRGARVLVSQLETSLEAAARALRLGHEAGVPTILNPAPMRVDFDPAVLADVSILIPNETELVALARHVPALREAAGPDFSEEGLAAMTEQQLHALCRTLQVETVIITLGARGCFVSSTSRGVLVPAMPGIKAIDTTGAGDAFVGAFATALAELGPDQIEAAARFANAAAALSVTRSGTAPAMPRRAEIDALLAQHR